MPIQKLGSFCSRNTELCFYKRTLQDKEQRVEQHHEGVCTTNIAPEANQGRDICVVHGFCTATQDPNGYGVVPEWPAMAGVEASAIVEIWVCRIVGNTLRRDGIDDMVDSLRQIAKLSDAVFDKPAIHGQNNLKASVNAWQPNITSRNIEWHNMAQHST